jgi:hypothetical protein
MNPKAINPHHQPETEFQGEFQEFSGLALAPGDPSLETRMRKGRPADLIKPIATDKNETPAQE